MAGDQQSSQDEDRAAKPPHSVTKFVPRLTPLLRFLLSTPKNDNLHLFASWIQVSPSPLCCQTMAGEHEGLHGLFGSTRAYIPRVGCRWFPCVAHRISTLWKRAGWVVVDSGRIATRWILRLSGRAALITQAVGNDLSIWFIHFAAHTSATWSTHRSSSVP